MVWFENPLALALIPVAGAALYYLLVRRPDDESTRRRYAVFGSRLVIVALLLLVVAQPFVVETTVVQGEDRVHMLVDNSDSMDVFQNVSQELAADIEDEGIQVDVTQVASERSSRLGDAVLANVRRGENVLLVSDRAEADASPRLEIDNDDVKCSHAATVGKIDDEELFYMQSRGLDEEAARNAIVEGFFEPVLDELPLEGLEDALRDVVPRKMHGPP